MMEIKVQCDCGQRFKFDVEPVNRRMPFVVNCPICGRDGTFKANEILAGLPEPAQPPPVPVSAAAAPAASSLRIRVAEHQAPEPSAEAPAQPEAAPAAAPRRFPLPSPDAAKPEPGKQPSFGLGLLGALVGSLVGSLIYYFLFRYTECRYGLMAIPVGYLSGLGAELLGRKEGSKELGMLAATLAIAGVFGAQYLVARSWWSEVEAALSGKVTYQQRVAEAQEAVKAIPTGSDEEIRVYLAKKESEPGEEVDVKTVLDDDVKLFREKTLIEDQEFASGKITKEQYEKSLEPKTEKEKKQQHEQEGTFHSIFMLLVLSKVNLFSMAAAAGLAYKVCANA